MCYLNFTDENGIEFPPTRIPCPYPINITKKHQSFEYDCSPDEAAESVQQEVTAVASTSVTVDTSKDPFAAVYAAL